MADNIGVAATGGTNADGSEWVRYHARDGWEVIASFQNRADGPGWRVDLWHHAEEVSTLPLLPSVWMSEVTACKVAEAVAVAVGHVLGVQGADPVDAIEEEADPVLTSTNNCRQCGSPFLPTSLDWERCGLCARGAKGI